MKSTFFILLFVLVSMGSKSSHKMPKGKNVHICIELDSSLCAQEQWVYMHRYIGNNCVIDDSAFVTKGKKKIELYAYTQEEDYFRILFTEKGPVDWHLIAAPNSHITTSISEKDGIAFDKEVKGSEAHNERYQKNKACILLNRKKRDLYAELAVPNISENEKETILAKIRKVNYQLDSIQVNTVLYSTSLFNTRSALKYSLKDRISKDSLIALCKIALKKFPKDPEIEQIAHSLPPKQVPPETSHSQVIEKRIQKLINQRLKKNMAFPAASKPLQNEFNFSSISLLSDKGEKVSVSQLKGKFLLIDFWASWCIPCRDGFSYIRQIPKLYNDKLTVCLISIDKRHDVWRKDIETEQLENFINLTAIDDNGKMDEKIEALNIKSIPYNVLLNADYQVIATNIPPKELLTKLGEIMQHQ